jgi:hypothetical protein
MKRYPNQGARTAEVESFVGSINGAQIDRGTLTPRTR